MNAEQLNGVLRDLADNYAKEDLLGELEALRASLDAIANDSNNVESQQNYRVRRSDVFDTLALSDLASFSIREAKIIEELGLVELTGPELRKRLEAALGDAHRTPRLVHDEVVRLRDQVSRKLESIRQVADGLRALGVGDGEPKVGEIELGLFIPRHGENLNLSTLLDEGTDLDRLVSVAYEIVEGRPQSPPVSFLTSCDYGYLVLMSAKVIKWLMDRLAQALEITKKYAEAKQAIEGLRKVNVPDEQVAPLLERQKQERDTAIQHMIEVAVRSESKADDHTKNDQIGRFSVQVKAFIDRHETRGNYVDIRVNVENAPPEGTVEGPELELVTQRISEQQQLRALAQRVTELEQRSELKVAQIAAPTEQ